MGVRRARLLLLLVQFKGWACKRKGMLWGEEGVNKDNLLPREVGMIMMGLSQIKATFVMTGIIGTGSGLLKLPICAAMTMVVGIDSKIHRVTEIIVIGSQLSLQERIHVTDEVLQQPRCLPSTANPRDRRHGEPMRSNSNTWRDDMVGTTRRDSTAW
jgi:hypothetical protein